MKVDAKGLVAGRLASNVAKALTKNESVVIVNAEQAVIVGNENNIMETFTQKVDVGVKSNPHFGPKYSRIPSRMLKTMIKGMLPLRSKTKERMIKNLKIYNALPQELASEKFEGIENAKYNGRNRALTLKQIAESLGGRW